jgi:glycosyltransferase involved in cell wall biosynthesis
MYKQLLICSRARFYEDKDQQYFQVNDGVYIDNISNLFENTIVLAGEVKCEEVSNETFLLKINVTCFNTIKVLKRNFLWLIRCIRKSNVVYVFYPLKSSLIIALLAKLLNRRVIAYNGGDWSQMKTLGNKNDLIYQIKVKFYNLLEYLTVKLSDAYLVNNNQLYNKYSHYGKLFKTVPLIRFKKDDKIFRDLITNKKIIKLLSVNHIKPGKKIIELLRGFKELSIDNKYHTYSLTIVGKYDLKEDYSKIVSAFIEENNIENVHFEGIINNKQELINYYRNSDIMLLITESEGFPRVIWEAFAHKLPVICSSLPNITLEFNKDVSPVLFLHGDSPILIKNAIEEIITNKRLWESLIEEGKKTFLEKTAQTPFEQFSRIIKDLNV